MDVALNTITLTLFTFIFMVQYFAVYCSLQTSLMQVMCCSDRVIFFFFNFSSIYSLIQDRKAYIF